MLYKGSKLINEVQTMQIPVTNIYEEDCNQIKKQSLRNQVRASLSMLYRGG